MASLAAGGESLEFCFANGHEKRQDEGLQREHRDLQGELCREHRDLQEGLETCNGCGLLQVASKGKCGYCETEVKQKIQDGAMRSWQIGMASEDFGKLLEREHVILKKMLEEVGKELPVGMESGRLYMERWWNVSTIGW